MGKGAVGYPKQCYAPRFSSGYFAHLIAHSASISTHVDLRGFYEYDWPINDNQTDYEVRATSGNLIASARTGDAA